MKRLIKFIMPLSLISMQAFSQANSPILIKANNTGFVHPDWAQAERCEVYSDKVVITSYFGQGENSFVVTEEKSISVDEGNIANIIIKAANSDLIESENNLCDAPSTAIMAYLNTQDGNSVKRVTLFSTGGCGVPVKIETDLLLCNLKLLSAAIALKPMTIIAS
ncbi:MAG: hypothetical protein R3B45_13125 [Bdellovibrionota bacterium]